MMGIIKYVDLFAGIGGMRIGFVQALKKYGFQAECVLSSEIDEKARETYRLNFGELPDGDICKITNIPRFDFLLAGFPCQPFSYAGKQLGFGDTRGTLFFEIERILDKYKPKGFLLENVRGLFTHDKGRTFATIKQKLNDLGYGIKDILLNSSDFGVPQNRVRLYILGLYNDIPKMTLTTNLGAKDTHSFNSSNHQYSLFDMNSNYTPKTVNDILLSNVDSKYNCTTLFQNKLKQAVGNNLSKLRGYRLIDHRGGKSLHSWELGIKGECTKAEIRFMNLLIQNRRKHHFGIHQDGKKLTYEQIKTFYAESDLPEVISALLKKGYLSECDGKYNPCCGNMSFEVFKFLDPKSISITLTSSDSNRLGIVQNNTPRRITPRECARLQGFPDSFICNPNDDFAYKQFGNSVSVPVIREVLCDFFSNNYIFSSSTNVVA
jgi:DNA (cytosine-5)-methyltransferase 1